MVSVQQPNTKGVDDPSLFDPIDRGQLVCWFAYALAFWGPVFAAIYGLALDSFAGSVALCTATAFALLTPSILSRSGSTVVAGNYLTLVLFCILLFLTTISGGHGSPPLIWNISIPIIVAMLTNRISAVAWAAIVVIQFVVFFLLDHAGIAVPQHMSQEGLRILEVTAMSALTLLVLSLAVLFEHYRKQMKDTLEAANDAKSEFLANMSDEIRTPMTAILGFAESLLEPELPLEERDDGVRTILRNGEHLLNIVSDILVISKIEANRLDISLRRFSIVELVWEIQDLMQPRCDEKGIDFEVEFTSPIPEEIASDPLRLRQILANLIGNAVKFTDKGSVRVIVHFLEDRFRPLLRIDVIDTGIGIAADQINRLFQPFAPCHRQQPRHRRGTGLGLAITKRLAEMLGGTISVHSEANQGSQFGLTLPTGTAGVPLIKPKRVHELAAASDNKCGELSKPLAGYRILVADDNADNRRLIALVLEKAGASVTAVVRDGSAADQISTAESAGEPFHALLMDLHAGDVDPSVIIEQLRGPGLRMPVIGVTAHQADQYRLACLAEHIDGIVAKPLNRTKLVTTVAAIAKRDVQGLSNPDSHPGRLEQPGT